MNLLVDSGNSRTKFVYVSEALNGITLTSTKSVNNCDLSEQWLQKHWHDVDKCLLATVSDNSLTQLITTWCKHQQVEFTAIEINQHKHNLQCAYEKAETFGVDRWLVMLGAIAEYPQKNLLVVDAGTATTLDIVTNKNSHIGGWIIPGIDMLFRTLHTNTSKIIAEPMTLTQLALGTNTSECVNHGSWAATLGVIELAILTSAKQGYQIDHIILTGGNGKQIQQLISRQAYYDEQLIFKGMAQYL